jgi:hypothetical protein
VVGAVSEALWEAEAPAPSAAVLTLARLVPEAELVDWLMRTTVVLVALAAAVPMLASVQFTERLAPGATGFGLTTMLCGIRSELPTA